ncbi:hypothetical protein [Devosia sp. FJ2-5-3]|uniref:hypothetical protein n=1 Tax=Devosia sp. FJ2-5-3 TaxID=2976680 RepID=UPI0023D8B525|nr:hypothetical protein [Devosia sp. FJ2-5-3]WEJ56731.1 ATP-binding protein [Devosia sp. FJ2-5-3]
MTGLEEVAATALSMWVGGKLGEFAFGYVCGKVTDFTLGQVDQRIRKASEQGHLPPNRVFERAALRSALQATRYCMDESTAEDMSGKAAGGAIMSTAWTGEIFTRGAPAARAYSWLETHTGKLHHKADERPRQEAIDSLMPSQQDAVLLGRKFAISSIAGAEVEAQVDSAVNLLGQHIINKVIAEGRWADGDHARQRLEESCASGNRWNYAFSHFYAQEIKEDTALSRLLQTVQLVDIASAQQANHAAVTELLKRLETRLDDLVQRAPVSSGPSGREAWAFKHMFRDPAGRIVGEDRFHFSAARDKFVGREKDLDTIRRSLFGDDALGERFLWMAVCGEGGTGKSRLCQELIAKAPDLGFMSAGFASTDFIQDKDWLESAADKIRENTLMVVDYSTNSMDQLPGFLDNWVKYAKKDTEGPLIRLIIILRNSNDPFFGQLERSRSDYRGQILAAERKPGGRRLALADLSDDEIVQLMRARMQRLAADSATAQIQLDAESLLKHLRRFDRFTRPLFALMVAEALQNGELDKIGTSADREKARFTLFAAYLQRQRHQYWQASWHRVCDSGSPHALEQHENAVRLATATAGLEIEHYDTIRNAMPEGMQEMLPERRQRRMPDSLQWQLIQTITGIEMTGAEGPERFAPLEPDLIGEFFVLKGKELSMLNEWALDLETLISLAYQHHPDRTLHFLRMAAQDYPQFMAERNFLLPELT